MSKLLENKVALITGGASGIGLETVRCLLRDGAQVMVGDINEQAGEQTVKALSSLGKVSFLPNNVADPDSCQQLVDKTVALYGKLDIAVNNAGIIGETKPLHECSLEGWKNTMDINLNGVFYGMRAQIPALLTNGGGVIVNITSIAGKIGVPSGSDYVTSKHAVEGMTKVAALEYSSLGIRINSVGPGVIETPLVFGIADKDDEKALESLERSKAMHPIGRLGKPEEVAELIVWLCSDRASFCTGGYYPVNGGYLAH